MCVCVCVFVFVVVFVCVCVCASLPLPLSFLSFLFHLSFLLSFSNTHKHMQQINTNNLALFYFPSPVFFPKRCILAGDHLQLPPTIMSDEAARRGLSLTLLERAVKRHPQCVRLLDIQYRMNEKIMMWSSQQFYEGRLVADALVKDHKLTDLEGVETTEDTEQPVVFIDTSGCNLEESVAEDNISKANDGEADVVKHHVTQLVKAGLKPVDIGVITPYNLQVERLRTSLAADYPAIEIKSVDGFQVKWSVGFNYCFKYLLLVVVCCCLFLILVNVCCLLFVVICCVIVSVVAVGKKNKKKQNKSIKIILFVWLFGFFGVGLSYLFLKHPPNSNLAGPREGSNCHVLGALQRARRGGLPLRLSPHECGRDARPPPPVHRRRQCHHQQRQVHGDAGGVSAATRRCQNCVRVCRICACGHVAECAQRVQVEEAAAKRCVSHMFLLSCAQRKISNRIDMREYHSESCK